jgi:hypothetical protein
MFVTPYITYVLQPAPQFVAVVSENRVMRIINLTLTKQEYIHRRIIGNTKREAIAL